MEDLKTIRVIYNPFLGGMSMYKSGRPDPADGWSFAHDPVVFLDLLLHIPDNMADCRIGKSADFPIIEKDIPFFITLGQDMIVSPLILYPLRPCQGPSLPDC